MFDDDAAALTPRSGASFEEELRRLLASVTSVVVGRPAVEVELAEGFPWHRAVPPGVAGPVVEPGAAAATAAAAATTAADPEGGFLPGALCSSVWSTDLDRAAAVAAQLRTGYTFINAHGAAHLDERAPFGGFNQSGMGRELGIEGIREFMDTHAVGFPA
ncbi:aldehyde dehydrogenase family protein [Modestobacter lapidis]